MMLHAPWKTRQRGDGSTAFDNTAGQVSGSYVLGRHAGCGPGLLVYVIVDNVEDGRRGGKEWWQNRATHRYGYPGTYRPVQRPAGNGLGPYEQPRKSPADNR